MLSNIILNGNKSSIIIISDIIPSVVTKSFKAYYSAASAVPLIPMHVWCLQGGLTFWATLCCKLQALEEKFQPCMKCCLSMPKSACILCVMYFMLCMLYTLFTLCYVYFMVCILYGMYTSPYVYFILCLLYVMYNLCYVYFMLCIFFAMYTLCYVHFKLCILYAMYSLCYV
jgi:hypothetical protein